MSKLSKKDIDKLSSLADLELTESEKNKILPQLSEIVSFFDQLKEVRTDNIEPTSQTTGLVNVMRSDEINNNRVLSAKEATLNAPKTHNDYFVVGALIDKDKNKS